MKLLFLAVALVYLSMGVSSAQDAPASPPPGITTATFIDLFEKGGVLMYPLAFLSVVAVFLIAFYCLTVRQGAVVTDKFMNAADALIRKQDYLGLLAVCNRQNECIARITEKTLDFATKNPTANFEDVREVTQCEGTRQASLLNQRITYLADVGSIAPMMGLLGTVFGMIKSFAGVGALAVTGDRQNVLATGVAEALITTAAGLVIGIPALIFYSIFRGRVQRLVAEMEAAATHLLALLAAQYKRSAGSAHEVTVTSYEPDFLSHYRDRTIDPRAL